MQAIASATIARSYKAWKKTSRRLRQQQRMEWPSLWMQPLGGSAEENQKAANCLCCCCCCCAFLSLLLSSFADTLQSNQVFSKAKLLLHCWHMRLKTRELHLLAQGLNSKHPADLLRICCRDLVTLKETTSQIAAQTPVTRGSKMSSDAKVIQTLRTASQHLRTVLPAALDGEVTYSSSAKALGDCSGLPRRQLILMIKSGFNLQSPADALRSRIQSHFRRADPARNRVPTVLACFVVVVV
ncbi:unnamed protein product, partial [Polarella glacialis]